MTGDIGLFLDANLEADLKNQGNDLATDDGLRTACIISLFTDRRADDDELPPEAESRRGWWGDLFPQVPGDKIGSRLWLLEREKRTVETLARAEEYCIEALTWLVDDGVAATVDADVVYDSNGAMVMRIDITRPSGKGTFRFDSKWNFEAEQES